MTGKVMVTGGQGFVGTHLERLLGVEADAPELDVLDPPTLEAAIASAQPRAVVHLAAQSSVAESWQDPADAWAVNVLGTVNILEAVRTGAPAARVLVASTGEVYGRAEIMPTPESAPVAPISPYAASKAAAELACQDYALRGLDIVVTRTFNIEGPGRDERFAIGSWTRQLARLEAQGGGVLEVGDLSSERDVTDVRDVCRAYTLLLEERVEPGTYNVATGRAISLEQIVELLVSLADCEVQVEQRPERLRPVEIPRLCGDASRLRSVTRWQPELTLTETLTDALAEAREAVAAETPA
jgi:nucleoside-diphosphate-sugar epimerase